MYPLAPDSKERLIKICYIFLSFSIKLYIVSSIRIASLGRFYLDATMYSCMDRKEISEILIRSILLET